MDESIILDTPEGIAFFRLCALKGAVKLESIGMRHSSGRSMRKILATELGLPPRTDYATVLARAEEKIEAAIAQRATQAVRS
jgi:hypothetical protein